MLACQSLGWTFKVSLAWCSLRCSEALFTPGFNSFPASVFFFFLSCQPLSAFLIIFTIFSWPQEYFVVWISEHAICQMKEQRVSIFKQQQNIINTKNIFINTGMWVSFIKKAAFWTKIWENYIYIWIRFRTLMKHRWSRSHPSTPPKLAKMTALFRAYFCFFFAMF